jgi:hypothetical protein
MADVGAEGNQFMMTFPSLRLLGHSILNLIDWQHPPKKKPCGL